MIIWSGAGLLVPAVFILAYLFTDGASMDDERQMAVALMVTGVASFILGFYYRKRADRIALAREGTEPEYGAWKRAIHNTFGNWEERPAFFFIPMHFWGFIGLGGGLFMYFGG